MPRGPDLNAHLRLYYNEVINTHTNLAEVLSNAADTVIDGRIPHHDLPKMLRDLAEREEIMASNWTLVRDGVFDKLIDEIGLKVTNGATVVDADANGHEAAAHDQTRKKQKRNRSKQHQGERPTEILTGVKTNRPKKLKQQAGSDESPEENTQQQVNRKAGILSKGERSETREKLERVLQDLREAKAEGNAEERLRASHSRKELQSTLKQHNLSCRLEAREAKQLAGQNSTRLQGQQIANAQGESRKVKKARIYQTRARQFKQQREDRTKREAKERLEKEQSNAVAAAWNKRRLQQKGEREARANARGKANDIAEASDQRAPSFPPPQSPLPPLAYEPSDVIIKEEVIEPWEI